MAKDTLTFSQVLTNFDPVLPMMLAANASTYGIWAVIYHALPDGSERRIAFLSQTRTPSEWNYAQIQKEALAAVFRVKKVHQYLYG